MQAGTLKAIVATSTLDLGIDWGDVDLVVHVGAPKGASRLAQRIGRVQSPHGRAVRGDPRAGQPFRGDGVRGGSRGKLSRPSGHAAAQRWCARRALPAHPRHGLRGTVRGRTPSLPKSAPPRPTSTSTGKRSNRPSISSPPVATRCAPMTAMPRSGARRKGFGASPIRAWPSNTGMNVGTIVEAPLLTIRLIRARRRGPARGGLILGKIEEAFLESLTTGDTFIFAGRTLRYEGIVEQECLVTDAEGQDPRIPAYAGGKFPLTTYLAEVVRAMLADPERWSALPDQVSDWLRLQEEKSRPAAAGSSADRDISARRRAIYLVAYAFEGRLAHQTLGMLLTRRMERAGARPLGFVATDYTLCIWAHGDLAAMIDRRLARPRCAVRPGHAGRRSGGVARRELHAEADLPQLRAHCRADREAPSRPGEERPPGHRLDRPHLRRAAHARARPHRPQGDAQDAAVGLLDVRRVAEMLSRTAGRIMHKPLEHISPLAVPIMMEIGRERVAGGTDLLLSELAEELEMEAFGIGQAPAEGRA